MKKISALILAVLFVLGSIPFSASAKAVFLSENVGAETVGNYEDILSKYVDFQSFTQMVRETISSYGTKINVSSYKIHPDSDFYDGLVELVGFGMPEYFHVDSIVQWSYPDSVAYYEVKYSCSAEEYEQKKTELEKATEELLAGVKGNDSLSDVEKALILHDRLALKMDYDYTFSKRDVYQAIVDGSGVCEGYTKGYSHLLNEVGIKNEYCVSMALNHAWNIVYIDGKPYHVDVTWDDVAWKNGERGVVGFVDHENFLRSTEGMKTTQHDATDYNSTPTDTTYDSFFWQSSQSGFVLLGNDLYFVDNKSKEIKRYSDMAVLASVDDIWMASGTSYWKNNYSRLATDGKDLYYSLPKAVYKYDIKKGTSEKIFKPELEGLNSIYGMEYSDGYIVCDINTAPPYSGGNSLAQVRYLLPIEETESAIVIKDSSSLSSDGTYLKGIKNKTTVSSVLSELENSDVVIVDKNGNVLSDSAICSTGCKVVLAYDGEVVDSLEIVVLGDVDGSGVVDATDYMRIKSVFVGKYSLQGAYFISADVMEDGVINSTDYLRIKSFFIGAYDLYA